MIEKLDDSAVVGGIGSCVSPLCPSRIAWKRLDGGSKLVRKRRSQVSKMRRFDPSAVQPANVD